MSELILRKIKAYVFLTLLGIALFLAGAFPAHAADVIAPSKDNVYTLTLTNIGTENIDGVNVSASVLQNPGGLVVIKDVTPQNATIPAGGSQAFQVKFDAQCGNLSGTETGKFKFGVTKSTPGPFYIKNCGIDPTTCAEFEGEFTVETEKNKPIITISGASNGATYYLPVSLTITYSVTDDKDPNPTVTANYPSGTVFDSEGSYSVVVRARDCAGNEDTKSLSFRIARRPRPDDTFSISDGKPTPITSDPFAKVAVLNRGLIGSMASILSGLKESYAVVNLPLDPETLGQYPLLIIPSDGLSGLQYSQTFKDALKQYAENGGVILSFTQERGYMLETLPGDWQGVGYLEENGCQTYAGGIENQHVLFSGQDTVYIDANVDGYFTTWPADATVLVRRTKNAMPCLLSYPVGQGLVLASTLYSDYGYISGQINLDEKRLIRDTISWAKDITTSINSYNAGNLANETVQILNKSNVDAHAVTYIFYDPDKKQVHTIEETMAEPLAPGQFGQENLSYQLPSGSPIGIYWIKYLLKDASGETIQSEEPTGRFAVKYNIGTVKISKDLNALVKTSQPFYPIGSTGSFEIVVTNAKTSDIPVRLRYGTSFHDPLYSAGSRTFEDKIIPAGGTTIFTVDVENLARGDYFSAGLFDQSDRLLAFGQEKFYVFYPFVKPLVSVDKNKYLPEENGTISYSLSYNFLQYINKTSYEATANIRILDQYGTKLTETSKTVMLTGTGFADELQFSAPVKGGRYIVQVEIQSFGRRIGLASSYFEVITGDFVTITPHYPATWLLDGGNQISFDLKNVSLSTLPSGAVKATLYDPDNAVAWTDEMQFQNLPSGSTTTLSFSAAIPNAKFGTYRLKYELSYMENVYEYFADFPNQMAFGLGFDKLSYKMRENMLLDLTITNKGLFQGDIGLLIEIPTFSYTDTRTVHVAGNAAVPYTIAVPTTLSPGTHDLNVTLLLANQLSRSYQFAVPASRLTLAIGKNTYASGETGTITVANTGGVDTNYSINIRLLDVNGNLVHETNDASSVEASSSQTASFTVPGSAISGNYLVQAECRNLLKGNEATVLSELINVSGVTGSLEVRTDKKTYLSSDLKNILSTLVNTSDKDISNATLRLRIYGQSDCKQPAAPAAGGGGGGGGEGEGPYIYPMVPDQFVCADSNDYSFNLHPYENSRGAQQITPKVLLIQDADSWNTGYQNQAVLNSLSIPYTKISSGQLSLTDLYQYTHIIVPSDQPQSMYNNLDINMNAITAWIQAGGSFQFNACDVGWAGGHWTYGPDQLRHIYPVYVQQNYITDPDHPVLQGMANSNFSGWNYVSHGYFTSVPENARILLSANADGSRPTLIDYTLGNGHVVASQNTLEWTNAGRNCPKCNLDILDNITKYMFRIGFDSLKWSAGDVDAGLMNISIDQTTDMMSITPAPGVYGADQVLLTLRDQAGLTATQWINVAVSPTMPDGNLLWEKEIPVAMLGTLDLTTEFDISQYKLTGKFYVEGTLISDISQEIAKDIDSFYIIDSDLGVTMETDKRVYKPGETATVTTSVTNNTTVGETGLTLVLSKEGVAFQSVTFDLAAGETRTFTATIAGTAAFLLEAKVKDVRIVDRVRVESPQVVVTVTGPDVAGLEDFDLFAKLENKGTTPAVVQLNFAGQTESVTLQPGQSQTYQRTLHISNTTTYYITLSGDVSQSLTKTVTYGALADIALSPNAVYPEGTAEVPYVITNTGSVDLAFSADFTLSNADTGAIVDRATHSLNLLAGGRVSDVLIFGNLTTGRYRLSHTSAFGSGSATFDVSPYNRVAIESATVGTSLTADGKLPVTAVIRNTGANSFEGNIVFDTGFYSEMKTLRMEIGASAEISVHVPLNVGTGNYEALITALYNYAPVSETAKQFSLMSLFAVTQMPSEPVFTPGDTGVVSIAVQNQGLVSGTVSIAVKGSDLIDVAQADRLSSGEERSFTFRFPVADDITANWYQAVVTVTNLDTGSAQDIPFSYYVRGYDIGVVVKTDKPCYPEGDTARVTLLVNNNAERGLEGEGVASFNDFYEKQNFMIGGKPLHDMIDTSVSPGDVMIAKVEAFTETDMGVFDSNHITLTGGSATYSYAWTYDQNGDIWTYGWSNGPLSKYNGKTGAWIKNVSIPYSGHLQIAVDKDGRMYGGYYYGSSIAVFNPETGAAIAQHTTPSSGYVAGVFWDGEYLWFGERLSSGNKYYRVDVSGGGWNIVNTFASNFNGYGYGMGVVGNRLLISNSTQDSFLYYWDLDFTTSTMSATYKSTPSQSYDYFTSFNYNGNFLQRKGYYSGVIRNYKAYRKAYAAAGTLLSAVQDAGFSEGATISWDADSVPGTQVNIETRTGNSLDPDGTWSAWSEQGNGNVITSPAARFLQYRATLSTDSDMVSPVLHSLSVDLPQQGRQIVHTTQEDFERMPLSLEYTVPISFTGQKLFYGIYSTSGWGIHLNSQYFCQASGDLLLYTDKQVYSSGETVTIHVYPYKTGTLRISAIGYENTFALNDTSPFDVTFTLPSEMSTGSYSIRADFLGNTLIYYYDVTGYTVTLQERGLDKAEYLPGDRMDASVTWDSNREINGVTVAAWIYSGGETYTYAELSGLSLAQGTNVIELTGLMQSHTWGFAEVTIALFKAADGDPYGVFLAADSIGFDIPDRTDPTSRITVGDPNFVMAGKTAVSDATTFSLSGEDTGSVVSGVARLEYRLTEAGPWQRYLSPFSLSGLPEGDAVIRYRSVDKAGNSEPEQSLAVIIDGTPPVTTLLAGEPRFVSGDGTLYVTGATPITLESADNLSGVALAEYRIDGGQWMPSALPVVLEAEGAHSIDYYSQDGLGNKEAVRTAAVVVDNTPPAVTLSSSDPLHDGVINAVSPSTHFTVSAEDALSGVKTLQYRIDGGSWQVVEDSFSLAGMGAGQHMIEYAAADHVGNRAAGLPLTTRMVVIDIEKEVPLNPRVLVLTQRNGVQTGGEAERKAAATALENLEQILATKGIAYTVATDDDGFRNAMRSGGYNTYLLMDYKKENLEEELREAVFYGEGLLSIKTRPNADPELDPVLNVKFYGSSADTDLSVTMVSSPLGDAGDFLFGGERRIVLAEALSPATQILGYREDAQGVQPLILFNRYGRGKALVFGFDLMNCPDQATAGELLMNAINYVKPDNYFIRPSVNLPVRIRIANSTEPVDVRIVETIPWETSAGSFVPFTTMDGNTIPWQASLAAVEKRYFGYSLNLPDLPGEYLIKTELFYDNNGTFMSYGERQLSFTVEFTGEQLVSTVLSDLQQFVPAGESDSDRIADAIRKLSRVSSTASTVKEAEQNIKWLLFAIEDIRQISVDTKEIRLKLDALLKIWQNKWYDMRSQG